MRIATGNEPGKCADAVSTVPSGKVTQVFFYRIVKRDEIGSEKAVDIAVPHLQSLFQGVKGDAVSGTFFQGFEIEMNRVPLAVFHLVQYGVETEFVPSFQKLLQPEGGFLLFVEATFLAKAFHLPISVAESHADGFRVRFVEIVHQCTPHGFFFGDACFEALFYQMGQQGLQSVITFPVFHFGQCSFSCRLVHQCQSL